jgi:hypothetical protein
MATATALPSDQPLIVLPLEVFQRIKQTQTLRASTGIAVKVEVIPHPFANVSVELDASSSLEAIQFEAQRLGLDRTEQCLVVVSRRVLSALHAQHKGRREREHTPVTPIHGFIPLVKREETARIREEMQELEQSLMTHGVFTVAQTAALQSLVEQERSVIACELAYAYNGFDRLRAVVYDLQTTYRNIYSSVHALVRSTEAQSLDMLQGIVSALSLPSVIPTQSTINLSDLLQAAQLVKTQMYDNFMLRIASQSDGAVEYLPADVKGIWRCVEKMAVRTTPTQSCAAICDAVRGALCSGSVEALAKALESIAHCGEVQVRSDKEATQHTQSTFTVNHCTPSYE